MKGIRIERVNNEIKRELNIIISNKLRDPQIDAMISVMEVQTAPDLSYAKVYISCYGTQNPKEILDRIKGAGGFLRGELSKAIDLRYTPKLDFVLDTSLDYGSKIDDMLNKISYTTKEDDDFGGMYEDTRKLKNHKNEE